MEFCCYDSFRDETYGDVKSREYKYGNILYGDETYEDVTYGDISSLYQMDLDPIWVVFFSPDGLTTVRS